MFIWHWPIAHLLVLFIPKDKIAARIVVFYFGTILISILSMSIIRIIKEKGMYKRVSDRL